MCTQSVGGCSRFLLEIATNCKDAELPGCLLVPICTAIVPEQQPAAWWLAADDLIAAD